MHTSFKIHDRKIDLNSGVPILKILGHSVPGLIFAGIVLLFSPINQSRVLNKVGGIGFLIPSLLTALTTVMQGIVDGFVLLPMMKIPALFRHGADDKLKKKYITIAFAQQALLLTSMCLLVWFLRFPLFSVLSIPMDIYPQVELFLSFKLPAFVLANLCILLTDIYFGIGSSVRIFIMQALKPCLELLSYFVFLELFDLGIVAVAIVDIPNSILLSVFAVIMITKHKEKGDGFEEFKNKSNPEIVKEYALSGITCTARNLCISLGYFVTGLVINRQMTPEFLTAMGIMLPFQAFLTAVVKSHRVFCIANYDKQHISNLEKGFTQMLLFSLGFALLVSILQLFLATPYAEFMGLTGETKDKMVLIWRVGCWNLFPWGILYSFRYLLEGMRKTKISLVAGIMECVGALICAFLLIPFFGETVVAMYQPIAWSFPAIFYVVYYLINRKKIFSVTE